MERFAPISSADAPTLSLPGTAVPTAGGVATAGATPNGNNNVYFARAFVQFAGFTAGKAVSVFDFFDTARYSLQTNFAYQDLGRFGIERELDLEEAGIGAASLRILVARACTLKSAGNIRHSTMSAARLVYPQKRAEGAKEN